MAPGEKAPERYFYHSFPRRGRETEGEIEKGCQILTLIRDFGLVMAPETVKWEYEHADGAPPRESVVLQQRVCFTELEPRELSLHAKKFGRFALEFDIPTLKSLGAVPVFYIPRALAKAEGAEGTASTLVMTLIDATVLLTRIEKVLGELQKVDQKEGIVQCSFGFQETRNKQFDLDAGEIRRVLEAFTHALTPPELMLPALEGLLKFFYPADDDRRDEVLGYYREREWRIAGSLAIRGKDLMARPSTELIDRLKALDTDFFGRELPPNSGTSLAEGVFVLPGLGDRRILQMARRIIVPEAGLAQAKAIFTGQSEMPPIISIEALEGEGRG